MIRIVPLLLIVLMGCSSQVADTTGGAETTNGFVVISSAGTPASHAAVTILANSSWFESTTQTGSAAIITTTADATGFVALPAEISDYSIQIETDDEALLCKTVQDTVTLSHLQTLTGTTTEDGVLYVAGSTWKTTIAEGTFSLCVPTGVFTLLHETATSFAVAQTISVDSDTKELDLVNNTALLFDDFNGGFDHNSLGDILDTTWWYTFSDSVRYIFRDGEWEFNGLSSHNGSSSFTAQIHNGELNVVTVLSDETSTPYAGIGASVYSAKPLGYDLSAMTHLNLTIQGSGAVQISLESDTLDSLNSSQYHYDLTLPAGYQQISIPVVSFHLDQSDSLYESTIPWTKAAENIRNIEFIFRGSNNTVGDTLTMTIDEIRFEGSSLPLL